MSVEQAVRALLTALGEPHIVQGSLEVHFDHSRYAGVVVRKHFKPRQSDATATVARAADAAVPVRSSVPDSSRERRM
jgi:hypothetical protein